jgi:hypothetical protein
MISLTQEDLNTKCTRRFFYDHLSPLSQKNLEKSFSINPVINYVLNAKEFQERLNFGTEIDIFPNANTQDRSYHELNLQSITDQTIKAIKDHPSVLIKNGYLHDYDTKVRRETAFDALEIDQKKAKLHIIYSKSAQSKRSLYEEKLDEIKYIFHVVKKALAHHGIELNRVDLYSTQRNYRRHGEINYWQMIQVVDISNLITLTQEDPINPALLMLINEPKEPNRIVSKSDCNGCAYKDKQCWPKPNGLTNISQFYFMDLSEQTELYHNFKELKNVPDSLLNDVQIIQKNAVINQQPYVDLAHIKSFISSLKYPLAFLDFETVTSTFPIYDGFIVNQTYPFQYALDVIETPTEESDDSKIKHYEYLGNGKDDPSKELLKQLLSQIPTSGDIVVFHSTAEKGFLKKLSELYGYETEIDDLINRLVDLKTIFTSSRNSFHYYHPEFNGSFSLKSVVKALLKTTYDDLEEIKDGLLASRNYEALAKKSDEEAKKIRENLIAYCNFDVRVMIKLLDYFKKL